MSPPNNDGGAAYLAVRLRLQLAKVYWALADHTHRPPPPA